MENLKIIFNPTNKNIEDIKKWGLEKTHLHSSFRNKKLVVAEYNNDTIGFYCLSAIRNDIIIEIETAEVKNEYRNKGIGKKMFQEIFKKYKNKKYYCFTLHCSPKESKFYWLKLGFKYFPENINSDKVEMFKAIKDINETITESELYPNTIEIIDDYETSYKWKFEVKENTNELISPIVFFGNYKWRMILTKESEILYNEPYNDFDNKNDVDSCIFIASIPEKHM
ncbi:GNAT family N-acetyltransferase [Chryseobacterium polytrichastri]|uniref:Acetyltransferase (GNAT) family protein n=1 Tax=Chryseobacterium polytrichastri TaxID=1302687 RepID=A0A1M7AZY0_9FLAO|nr:GNAT family N-acetyltransferase [Chryseobacterium polytrichastri]SHL48254.1 Acetyltransferase (GNAT) family protein [Chryseobacterium polytrichastri]